MSRYVQKSKEEASKGLAGELLFTDLSSFFLPECKCRSKGTGHFILKLHISGLFIFGFGPLLASLVLGRIDNIFFFFLNHRNIWFLKIL